MNLYISGISGTGMGPLALMAADAGFSVQGSDLAAGAILPELQAKNIPVQIGPQDGVHLETLLKSGQIDWFVHTSALPPDHPELTKALKYGIKVSKRDELIAYLVAHLHLKMVAVAGTHGKTTTVSMLIWACRALGLPVSYLVGTTLPFAPAGIYRPDAQFFLYEADEYDRNFLHFHPWLSVITSVSYDHPDIYPTPESYQAAFAQFARQSRRVITPDTPVPPEARNLTLAGSVRRFDASLALAALLEMTKSTPVKPLSANSSAPAKLGADSPTPVKSASINPPTPVATTSPAPVTPAQIVSALNAFPGVGRRFERLAPGVYTDYAHHPEEIQATIQTALEESRRLGLKGVVAVYQPHQNTRQHSVSQGYKSAFTGVSRLYWLPTYLTREDPNLPVITPSEFLHDLANPEVGVTAELNQDLATALLAAQKAGFLVILLTAGPADDWFRAIFANKTNH